MKQGIGDRGQETGGAARESEAFVSLNDRAPEPRGDRTLCNVVIATTGLAADGAVMLPGGCDTALYLKNPIVTARHLAVPGDVTAVALDANPIVIARTLALHGTETELVVDELQFADTKLGREYAYLYGCNPEKEVFMRAWSVEVWVQAKTPATFDQARKLSGAYWNEQVAARVRVFRANVSVVTKSVLNAFAAVALGADRFALSRACRSGNDTAAEMICRMDTDVALVELAALRRTLGERDEKISQLNEEVQALRRDGAAAAARGDSAAILEQVRELRKVLRGG